MHAEELQHFAVEAATRDGPLEAGLTMLVLTECERRHLLRLVAGENVGPGASARMKLRSAAPVRDAGWKANDHRGFFRFLLKFFETDGRHRGKCRWCRTKTRIDQYGLCARCAPPSSGEDGKGKAMNRRNIVAAGSMLCLLSLTAFIGCATSPTGRKQLHLLPDSEVNQMGITAFEQLKQQTPQDTNPRTKAEVECVVDAVGKAAIESGAKNLPQKWDVVVFQNEAPNAFALPGGKVGVHTGIFKVAKTPGQLATVIGHEMSHVIANHGNERMSTALATATGLELIQILSNTDDPEKQKTRQMIFGLLGVGAQVGILLPFSRADETEADRLGFDLMGRAGFNPEEGIALWKNMDALGGNQPPQFLSDHPSHGTRIADLQARLPHAMSLYRSALASGHTPACRLEGIAIADEFGECDGPGVPSLLGPQAAHCR
jgi:Zn-dependent protease with chaperone function